MDRPNPLAVALCWFGYYSCIFIVTFLQALLHVSMAIIVLFVC